MLEEYIGRGTLTLLFSSLYLQYCSTEQQHWFLRSSSSPTAFGFYANLWKFAEKWLVRQQVQKIILPADYMWIELWQYEDVQIDENLRIAIKHTRDILRLDAVKYSDNQAKQHGIGNIEKYWLYFRSFVDRSNIFGWLKNFSALDFGNSSIFAIKICVERVKWSQTRTTRVKLPSSVFANS